MNDIATPPRSITRNPAPAIRPDPHARPEPRLIAGAPPAAEDQRFRLTWRVLDRLAAAAALGVVFASPRSALLSVEVMKPRIYTPTSTSTVHANADARRQGATR